MNAKDTLVNELDVGRTDGFDRLPAEEDIFADINSIYQSYSLQTLVRFYKQTYWETESIQDAPAPGRLYLENVAAHTFQVASAAQLLVTYFPTLDRLKTIELALVHDQPEILIGDKDPVGPDGQGLNTHAFNPQKQSEKEKEERYATRVLASRMRGSARFDYENLIKEFLDCKTDEARFIKAVDKLQALVFMRIKKSGSITPQHMAFTIRYSRSGLEYFPALKGHFKRVLGDMLSDVERRRPEYFGDFCADTKHWLATQIKTSRTTSV